MIIPDDEVARRWTDDPPQIEDPHELKDKYLENVLRTRGLFLSHCDDKYENQLDNIASGGKM
jgi:hypothetical protein